MDDRSRSWTPQGGRRRRKTYMRLTMAVVAARTMISSAFSISCSDTLESLSRPLSKSSPFSPRRQCTAIHECGRRRRLSVVSTSIEESTIPITPRTVDITMEDVVTSASIEIERQRQEQYNNQVKDYKTPFELFEEHDKFRVMESEQVGLDRLRIDEEEPKEEHWRGRGWGGSIDPSEIVSWNELKALMEEGMDSTPFSSINTDRDAVNDRVRELYETFQNSGGFLVVQLDEKDAATVSDMWSTMEAYFSLPPEKLQVDTQILKKDDGSHDPEAGYHFRQTYMNIDGEILPETIQNALEEYNSSENNNIPDNRLTHDRGIEGSYRLFADLAKTVGTIVSAGALGKDLSLMSKVATSMLDDKNGHPFVNADHRLSRYILSSNTNKKQSAKESLISHTDWTYTTCIPLSAIPGLQVWKPDEKEWIVPEAILGGKDRTSYVVVMAGKWIELLTSQKITSCVHRVVTMNDGAQSTASQARLSAPFFCRTKRSIFDTFQDEFDESWEAPSGGVSNEQAIESMGNLFADWIRFLEGDRDPSIQDCVVDLCLDREDKAPGCYSVEEVLRSPE